MTDIAPRDSDRCPTCGTPLEPIGLDDTDEPGTGEIVFRCANGHELRVERHVTPPDPTDPPDPMDPSLVQG